MQPHRCVHVWHPLADVFLLLSLSVVPRVSNGCPSDGLACPNTGNVCCFHPRDLRPWHLLRGMKEVSRSVPPPPLVLLEEETLRCVLTWTGTGRFAPVSFGCTFLCDTPPFLRSIPSLLHLFPFVLVDSRRGSAFFPTLPGVARGQRPEGGGGGGRSTESSTSAGIVSGGTRPRGSPLLPRETMLPLWQWMRLASSFPCPSLGCVSLPLVSPPAPKEPE